MTHSELVDIAHRLVLKKLSCGCAYKEKVTTATTEIPDVIGFGAWGHSVLIEVKVSRAYFKRNAYKAHKSPMGKYRFFCVPDGLVTLQELPQGWGLIEINEKGRVSNIFNPYDTYWGVPPSLPKEERVKPFDTCYTIERNFMYSVLRSLT